MSSWFIRLRPIIALCCFFVTEALVFASKPVESTAVYIYGLDLINQHRKVSGVWETRYYGYDAQGSVRFLTDHPASGQAVQMTDRYAYDAFGTLILSSGSMPNHYRYTGEQWDGDLQLYYLRARYYNPNTGRFWSLDTYEGSPSNPRSLHKNLYCANDPVNPIDPSGLADINLASLTVSIGTVTALAANTAIRIIPTANRIIIALYEGASGATVVGGAGLPAGGKAVITIGGGRTKVVDVIAKAHTKRIALQGFEEAEKYGVWPFKLLEKLVRPGSGLQKHHLVEKRFSDLLGVAAADIPNVALTVEEHAKYTARSLEQIARRSMNQPLRTDTATVAKVWEAAQDVYADAPELIEFVKVFLGK